MDDQNFNNPDIASNWIKSIESKRSFDIRSLDIYPQLKSWVKEHRFHRILEIGCGQGACSDQIDLGDGYYTGLDPCSIMISRANKLYANSQRVFAVGNAYSLPSEDKSFDAVFSVAVWHLLSDIHTAAKELSRVLKNEGRFLIITANPSSYDEWQRFYSEGRLDGKRFKGKVQNSDGDVDILYFHSEEEIVASLERAGFTVQTKSTFRPNNNSPDATHFYILILGQLTRTS